MDEPDYAGDDPLFHGCTKKMAELLEKRPQIPRTLGAVVPRVNPQLRARMFRELASTEWGEDFQAVFARWWRVALQELSEEELEAVKSRALAGGEEVEPPEPFRRLMEEWQALSEEEKAAREEQRRIERLRDHRRRLRDGEEYLVFLRELVADEEHVQQWLRGAVERDEQAGRVAP